MTSIPNYTTNNYYYCYRKKSQLVSSVLLLPSSFYHHRRTNSSSSTTIFSYHNKLSCGIIITILLLLLLLLPATTTMSFTIRRSYTTTSSSKANILLSKRPRYHSQLLLSSSSSFNSIIIPSQRNTLLPVLLSNNLLQSNLRRHDNFRSSLFITRTSNPITKSSKLYATEARVGGGKKDDDDRSPKNIEEKDDDNNTFQPGTKIQVEIISFGPLGATVDVIGIGSHNLDDIIPESEPPLATGLILQKEIQYYRQKRNNVDVVVGEILPAYVEKFRDDLMTSDSLSGIPKLDISLRAYGGKAKTDEASQFLLDALYASDDGILPIGDKSTPGEITRFFPGISKGTFKKAVASLYKQQIVQPSPYSIQLIKKNE